MNTFGKVLGLLAAAGTVPLLLLVVWAVTDVVKERRRLRRCREQEQAARNGCEALTEVIPRQPGGWERAPTHLATGHSEPASAPPAPASHGNGRFPGPV